MRGKAGVAAAAVLFAAALSQGAAEQISVLALRDCGSDLEDSGFNELVKNQLDSYNETVLKPHYEPCGNAFNVVRLIKEHEATHVVMVGVQVIEEVTSAETIAAIKAEFGNTVTMTTIDQGPAQPSDIVQAFEFKEDEGGFVAGYLAGSYSRTKIVGGIFGVPFDPLRRFRAGFINGVRMACEECQVISQYLWSFSSGQRGKIAAGSLADQNADVLFVAAGGAGAEALKELDERRVAMIGVDQDQFVTVFKGEEKKKYILSSVLKRVDVAVERALNNVMTGFQGGKTTRLGYAQDALSMADKHASDVPDALVAELATLANQFKAGTISSGVDAATSTTLLSNFYSASRVKSNSWTPVRSFGPTLDGIGFARGDIVDVLGIPTFYMFGGVTDTFDQGCPHLLSFDTATMSWTNHSSSGLLLPGSDDALPDGRQSHIFTSSHSAETPSLVLFGGRSLDDVFEDTWILYPASTNGLDRWERTLAIGPSSRDSHCAAGADGKVYVFGGRDSAGDILNDLWAFDVTEKAWSLICSSCGPEPREHATMTRFEHSDGSVSFYLHGGKGTAGNYLSDLWEYKPGESSFVQRTGAVAARAMHSATRLLARPPSLMERTYVLAVTDGEFQDNTADRVKRSIQYYIPAEDRWEAVATVKVEDGEQCVDSTSNQLLLGFMATQVVRHGAIAFARPTSGASNDKLFVFGGLVDAAISQKTARLDIFHPGENDIVEEKNFTSSTVGIVVGSLVLAIILLALLCLVWTYRNRRHSIVRASQTPFLSMVAVGAIISSFASIPAIFDDSRDDQDLARTGDYEPANIACGMMLWFYAIGFIITFVPLFAKVWRVQKIFHNTRLRRIVVSTRLLVMICVAALSVEATILLVWQATAPLKYVRTTVATDDVGNVKESVGSCTSESSTPFLAIFFVLHMGILLFGILLSWRVRKVEDRYSESKYITIVLVSMIQVLLIAAPVLIIVFDEPLPRAIVLSGVLFLNNISVLGFIFGPKYRALQSGKFPTLSNSGSNSRSRPTEDHLSTTHLGSMTETSFHHISEIDVMPPKGPPPRAPESF